MEYKIVVSEKLDDILKKLSKEKPTVLINLKKQIMKVANNPYAGKPLRNVLKNYRRVHIGPFVLVYEIHGNEIRLENFTHHDKAYK